MSDSINRLGEEQDATTSDEAARANQSAGDEEIEIESGSTKAAAPRGADEKISALKAELAQTKAELEKFRDLALRSSADLDNYRKRMSKKPEGALKCAN